MCQILEHRQQIDALRTDNIPRVGERLQTGSRSSPKRAAALPPNVANQRKRKVDETIATTRAALDKMKRFASEPSLGRQYNSPVRHRATIDTVNRDQEVYLHFVATVMILYALLVAVMFLRVLNWPCLEETRPCLGIVQVIY